MKLHLPKILLSAVVAVCCAQAAHAGTEKKTYTVGEGESAVTYNVTVYTGASNNNMRPDNVTLLQGTNMVGFELTSSGSGNYFYNGDFDCSRAVYISKGAATGDEKVGLILNNGNEGKIYTFSGDIYGDGDIYKKGSPANGLTLKFTGNMSAYTGNTLIEGASGKNVLIYDGATTGTGTIESNGTIKMNSTIINSSRVETTGLLEISGNSAVVGNVALSAGNIALATTIGTNANGAGITLKDNQKITLVAEGMLSGSFASQSSEIVGVIGGVEGNGFAKYSNVKLFSDSSKVQSNGVDVSLDFGTLEATESGYNVQTSYYVINSSESYNSEVMNGATHLWLQGNTTVTLTSGLSPTLTGGIVVGGANASINLVGNTATLNQSSVKTNGRTVTLKGDGVFTVTSANLTDVKLDANSWTGCVKYSYSNKDNNLSTGLATLGNPQSTIALTGAGGYFDFVSKLGGLNLELSDNGSRKALTISNGGSFALNSNIVYSYLSANLSGQGTVEYSFASDDTNRPGNALLIEGDISKWTGQFNYTNAKTFFLKVTGDATEVKAGIGKTNSNATLNLIVDNAGKTTTFNNTVNVTSFTTTDDSSVKLAGKMTTGSFTLGDRATLTLAGGSLNVTGSLTLNALSVDFSKYSTDMLTHTLVSSVSSVKGWAGDVAGSYVSGDSVYSTSISLVEGNTIELTYTREGDSSITTTVTGWKLSGTALTLNVDAYLCEGMVVNVNLLAEEMKNDILAQLAQVKGDPMVFITLQGSKGGIITADKLNEVVFVKGDTGQNYWGEMVGGKLMYSVDRIPEPASATLSLAALMMLCARRRRRA